MPQPSSRLSGTFLRVLGVLLALGGGLLRGQGLAFRAYDHRDGLPQSQVTALLEDRDGFLWVGTQEALARLGPGGFRVYGPGSGLRARATSVLMQDRQGSVWVGGLEDGLSEVRGSRVANYGAREGLAPESVYALAEDGAGRLLAGTPSGLFVKRGTRFERIPLPAPWERLPLYALAVDGAGRVWMGSRQGNLARWDGQRLAPVALPADLAREPVLQLAAAPDGRVHAVLPGGVMVQGRNGAWQRLALPGLGRAVRLRGIGFGPGGERLVLLGTDGLYRLGADGSARLYGRRDGLPRESVVSALRDRHGTLWLGTDGGGLLGLATPGLSSLYLDPDTGLDLGLGTPTCFRETAPGRVYIAGSAGLCLWEEGRGIRRRWGLREGLPSLEVWALEPDGRGGLWIGTVKGMARLAGGRILPGPSALARSMVHSFLRHQGRLWACTLDQGLVELGPDGRFLAAHPPPPETGQPVVAAVLARPDGLLVGTRLGLYRFQGGRWERRYGDSPVAEAYVSTLYQDAQGGLWVGTLHGLHVLRHEAWSRLGAGEGLPHDTVNWVRELPGGILAVGHGLGVSLRQGGRSLHLSRARGLLSDETTQESVMLDHRGRLWIGMVGGVSLLDTRELPWDPPLPRPTVLELRWQDGSAWLPRGLELGPNPGALLFSFDLGMPAVAAPPAFQVRIDGLDTRWREPEDPAARLSYARLEPGRYVFRVRASRDGVAWTEGEPLVFRIRPAWYQRRLVHVVLVLATVGLAALGVQWRMRRLRGRARVLEDRVRERTEELELRNRSLERLHRQLKRSLERRVELVRRVAHDLRSPLASITLSADLLKDRAAALPEAARSLGVMTREAQRMESILKALLDHAREEAEAETFNPRLCHPAEVLHGLSDTLRLKAEALDLETRLELDPADAQAFLLADSASLQQVLFNLLENALKYTPAPGTVGIRSRVRGDAWVLEVWDTGVGIPAERLEAIFEPFRQARPEDADKGWGLGLAICRSLVEAHQGRLEVESAEGAGSTFRVVLPLVTPEPS
jgi:signal transduction histidine kinase/ligand-binding sensor domain-containing protein